MVLPAAQRVTATLQRPNYDPAYQVLPLCVHRRVHVRLIFASVWVTAAYGHTDGPLLLTSCSLVSQWHIFCVFKVHLLGNELSNTLRAREESIHPQELPLWPDLRCKSVPIGFIFKTEQRIITQETNKYYINNDDKCWERVWFLWGFVLSEFSWTDDFLYFWSQPKLKCNYVRHVYHLYTSLTFVDSNTNINSSKRAFRMPP